jgi:hypothetical protein
MYDKNRSESEPDFLEILSLLAQGYGKNKVVTGFVRKLARLTRDKWALVELKVVGGGPSIDLNIRTRNRIIKLPMDLVAKLNVLVFKKYANEKNYKRRKRGQAAPGTSNTESQR